MISMMCPMRVHDLGGGDTDDMGWIPSGKKDNLKRGQWTPEEDNKLLSYIVQNSTCNWRIIPMNAGLHRCWKSCQLRWTNYMWPDLRSDEFNDGEQQTNIKLHCIVGNMWPVIVAQMLGWMDKNVQPQVADIADVTRVASSTTTAYTTVRRWGSRISHGS